MLANTMRRFSVVLGPALLLYGFAVAMSNSGVLKSAEKIQQWCLAVLDPSGAQQSMQQRCWDIASLSLGYTDVNQES